MYVYGVCSVTIAYYLCSCVCRKNSINAYLYLLSELKGLHRLFAIQRRLASYSQPSACGVVMRDGVIQ